MGGWCTVVINPLYKKSRTLHTHQVILGQLLHAQEEFSMSDADTIQPVVFSDRVLSDLDTAYLAPSAVILPALLATEPAPIDPHQQWVEIMAHIKRESVLVNRDALMDAYREIFKLAGFGLGGVLKKTGELAWKQGIKHIKEQFAVDTESLDDVITGLSSITVESGMAKNVEWDSDSRQIYIQGSLMAQSIGTSKRPVCYPLSGFIKGFVNEFAGTAMDVEEIQCQAQGHLCCTFQLKDK